MAASGVTSNDSVLTGNGTMLTKYARTWSIVIRETDRI